MQYMLKILILYTHECCEMKHTIYNYFNVPVPMSDEQQVTLEHQEFSSPECKALMDESHKGKV